MSKKVLTFLLGGLSFMTPQGQGGAVLRLDDYVETVREQDLQVQQFLNERMQTRFQADLELPSRSWLFALSDQYGFARGGAANTNQKRASVNKTFSDTGTAVELSYQTNDLADRRENVQAVNVRQSLIRNAFGNQTRSQREFFAHINQVTKWQVVESYEDYLAQKISDYLDFMQAYQNYLTAKELYDDVKRLASEVRQRRETSIANQVDVDRSTVEALTYERRVLEARVRVETLTKSLLESVSAKDRYAKAIEPQLNIPYVDLSVDTEAERQAFFEGGRTLKILKANAKASQLDIDVKESQL